MGSKLRVMLLTTAAIELESRWLWSYIRQICGSVRRGIQLVWLELCTLQRKEAISWIQRPVWWVIWMGWLMAKVTALWDACVCRWERGWCGPSDTFWRLTCFRGGTGRRPFNCMTSRGGSHCRSRFREGCKWPGGPPRDLQLAPSSTLFKWSIYYLPNVIGIAT